MMGRESGSGRVGPPGRDLDRRTLLGVLFKSTLGAAALVASSTTLYADDCFINSCGEAPGDSNTCHATESNNCTFSNTCYSGNDCTGFIGTSNKCESINNCLGSGNTCGLGEGGLTQNDCTAGATNSCLGDGANKCVQYAENSCDGDGSNNVCSGVGSNTCGRNGLVHNNCTGDSPGESNTCSGSDSNVCLPGYGFASNDCRGEEASNSCSAVGSNACEPGGAYISNNCAGGAQNTCTLVTANTCVSENTCSPGDALPH